MKTAFPFGIATLALFAACNLAQPVAPSPTPGPTEATVTDLSAPLASSEAGALADRGFLGSGDLGRLDRGCVVTILKTTDRAAQVDVSNCQTIDGVPPHKGLQGWVAKSALTFR